MELPFDSISDLEATLRNQLKSALNTTEEQTENALMKKYVDEIAKLKNVYGVLLLFDDCSCSTIWQNKNNAAMRFMYIIDNDKLWY